MFNDRLQEIKDLFRNMTLNALGVERSLYDLLQSADVSKAIDLMQNHDKEVDEAIKEYNPETHAVMDRRNKSRKDKADYIVEKLPRTRQRYINEVELFFLLGKDIVWTKNDGSDKAFDLFTDFLADTEFDSNMRKAKRLAGAETESAKLYHLYRNEKTNEIECRCVVLARSTGYKLRPLIDQYGRMAAFAYGYCLNEGGKSVQHWDIQTEDLVFNCKKGQIGWQVDTIPNPTGKINVIYYRQPKAWDGAEIRIDREEMLDSKVADTNNYFADPIAAATTDVIELLAENDTAGKLIQLTGQNSTFQYINPPQSSETREAEKNELQRSILFDTFTPDLSFENLRGMGTLSGAAIKNAMILGFIKRDNRKEIYGSMLKKEKNLIIGILKYMHPDMAAELDKLDIAFEFAEPFNEDAQSKWGAISSLYQSGLLSQYTAISKLGVVDFPQDEIDRITEEGAERNALEQQKAEAQSQMQTNAQMQLAEQQAQLAARQQTVPPTS